MPELKDRKSVTIVGAGMSGLTGLCGFLNFYIDEFQCSVKKIIIKFALVS